MQFSLCLYSFYKYLLVVRFQSIQTVQIQFTKLKEKEAAREAAKQQKQQQELQKQLKASEQKRERERKLKAELAEAAKLERDQMLIKKIADEKAYLENIRQIKKEEPKTMLHFDLLETDDSTDDEDTVSKNRPNRPLPPAWSLRKLKSFKEKKNDFFVGVIE